MYESTLSFPGSLYSHFDRLRRELDDVFGDAAVPSGIRSVAPGTFPAINIGNTPTHFEVCAFAPGLDAKAIDITLDRGVLTVSGERPANLPAGQGEQANIYSRERVTGRFKRVVSLPEDIDATQVSATYRDGLLRISVARRGPSQPQRITVQ